jgi:V8-like Glu-specific endopeptidase
MKVSFEELESPYLDGELEFVVPTNELSTKLAYALGESPFASSLDLRGAETGEPAEGLENQSAWPYEADESTPQELVPVEANLVDEDEQERSDDGSSEVETWTSESDETEQSIDGGEAYALDEASAFENEEEEWIQGGDLFAPDAESDSIDFAEVAELDDELSTAIDNDHEPQWEYDTAARLNRKLKSLSLLPHVGVIFGNEAPLSPLAMNPGIYDDPVKYKVAGQLQKCLNTVMNKKEFRHIKVALVDLTKGVSQPEFAGFFHKQQVAVANIPKIAPMLAAFQLRRDLRVALRNKGLKSLNELFDKVRDDWGATQLDVKAPVKPFTSTITRRRDLVLVNGATVRLVDPKSPQLERVFATVQAGDPATVEFSTTGEDEAQLEKLAGEFRDGKPDSQKNIDNLGFRERLRLMMMGRTRASNYAASTIVADVGYLYIASTLLQSGLFDPARGGGLWLASNYAGKQWPAGAALGGLESANPASLAAFLTLLMQDQLVDRDASTEMRDLLTESVTSLVDSSSTLGLKKLPDEGSLITVLSRSGISAPGMHDCAVVERQSNTAGKDVIRYIAVGLGSVKTAEWQSLIVDLDKCILANNSLTPSGEVELELPQDESGAEPQMEEEKGIIGGHDERMPVKDTLAVPFRWVCKLWIQSRIKFGAGHEEKTGLAPLATGVLITPRHVLTAAHVLHSLKQRGSVTEEHVAFRVEVAPAANQGLNPFGRIEAASWKIAANWKPGTNSSQFDYALITLKERVGDRTLKEWNNKRLCYWGSTAGGAGTSVDAVPSALLKKLIGTRVATAGYPETGNGEMICAAGLFSAGATSAHLTKEGLVEDWVKRTAVFFITADASEGQSGSPVWILDNGKRYLIGVLAAIGDDYNTVVNLRVTVLKDLRNWIK